MHQKCNVAYLFETDTSSSGSNNNSISSSGGQQHTAANDQQHQVQQQPSPLTPQQQDDRGSILLGAILKHRAKSRDLQAWIHSAKHTIPHTTFRQQQQPSKPVVGDNATHQPPEVDEQNLTTTSPPTSPVVHKRGMLFLVAKLIYNY